jgi:hypothetical protein
MTSMKPTPDDPLYELHKLYPRATENELAQIKEALDAYLAVALKVFERMEKDPEAMTQFRAEIAERRKQQNQGL